MSATGFYLPSESAKVNDYSRNLKLSVCAKNGAIKTEKPPRSLGDISVEAFQKRKECFDVQTINPSWLEKQERKPIMPEAVVRWTRGLDAAPEIFPMGETPEETRQVEQFLERRKLLRDE